MNWYAQQWQPTTFRGDERLWADDGTLRSQIRMTILDKLGVEERLDLEVHRLLAQDKNDIAMGRMNDDELYRRAKQRLTNERNRVV